MTTLSMMGMYLGGGNIKRGLPLFAQKSHNVRNKLHRLLSLVNIQNMVYQSSFIIKI
jgi:hypothetical protein